MIRFLGVVLLALGAYLIFVGVNREHSFAGKVSTAENHVSNAVTGQNQQPTHTVEIISGCVLVIVGLGIAVRRPSPA